MERKAIARFVVREDGNGRSNLILGIALENTMLKPGFVYEIRVWPEELKALFGDEDAIVEVGPSCIPNDYSNGRTGPVCWGNGAAAVIEQGGRCMIMTKTEYVGALESDRKHSIR